MKKSFIIAVSTLLITGTLCACAPKATNTTARPTTAPTTTHSTFEPTIETLPIPTTVPTQPPHVCFFEEVERKDATCTEEGYSIHRCECGNEMKAILGSTDHIFKLVDSKEPTKTEPGYTSYVCAICGEESVLEVPATGE